MKNTLYTITLAAFSLGTLMAMTPEERRTAEASHYAAQVGNPAAVHLLRELRMGGAQPGESAPAESPEAAAELRNELIKAVKAGRHIKVEAALEAGAPANALADGVALVVLAARHVNAQDPNRNEYYRITARLLKYGGAKGFTAQELLNQIPNADAELQALIRKRVK